MWLCGGIVLHSTRTKLPGITMGLSPDKVPEGGSTLLFEALSKYPSHSAHRLAG